MPLHEVAPGDQVELGPFTMEPVKLAHSIPDMFGIALECDLGITFFTGDYKFDQTPVDGVPADVVAPGGARARGDPAPVRRLDERRPPGHGPVRVERRPAPRGGLRAHPRADRHHLLRLEHPPGPAGRRRRPGHGPQGRARRPVDAQVREHRRPARAHRRPGGDARPARRDRRLPRRAARDHLDGQPGRAAVGAPPDGPRRPSACRAARARHGHLLRDPDPRERARGQRDDRPHLPAGRRRDHHPRRADPRVRARQRRGAQADDEPD